MIFYFACSKEEDLKVCGQLIDRGSVVVFPTDTVYGIGCNPSDDSAVLRLFKIKNRPQGKYLPILAKSFDVVTRLVNVNAYFQLLAKEFWPGQLTLVAQLKDGSLISKHAYNNNDRTVAIRIPDNRCTIGLIGYTKNELLVGTSANISGESPSGSMDELKHNKLQGYDAIVNGGALGNKKAVSTIVNVATPHEKPLIIREGLIPKEKIFAALNLSV
jgi:L-threonylcarbamoyladenylate synthase